LADADEPRSPYLSVDDALKLDEVCGALRRGDLRTTCPYGRVFALTPVAPVPA
jgi:hypothetical protein